MAVYTDVSEGELEAFLRDYPVGQLLSYKGIAEGSENSNFLLHTTAGSFILTLYEKRVDRDDLPFFLGLMEHLAGKGISCPLPVKRSDGELIGELAGRPAALITFLEGMWMRRPTVGALPRGRQGAGAAASGRRGFSAVARRMRSSIDGWRKLWQASRDRADEVEPGLAAEIDADFAALDSALAGRPAGRRHPCRPVSRTMSSSSATSCPA